MKLHDHIHEAFHYGAYSRDGYKLVGYGSKPTPPEGYHHYILISDGADVFIVDIRKLEV